MQEIHNVFLPASVIQDVKFEDAQLIKRLFSSLDARKTVLLCLKISFLITGEKHDRLNLQYTALNALVYDGIITKQEASKCIARMSQELQRGFLYLAFTRPNLFEFIRNVLIFNDTVSNVSTKNFLLCVLISSELYASKEIRPSIKRDSEGRIKPNEFILGERKGHTWGGGILNPELAIGRTKLLLADMLINNEEELSKAFKEIFLMDIDEWLLCNSAIIFTGFDLKKEGEKIMSFNGGYELNFDNTFANSPHINDTFDQYLNFSSMTFEELETLMRNTKGKHFNFRPLRKKPLLRLSQSKGIILDREFFIENMMLGPLFTLAAKLGSERTFKKFGDAFERYCLKILDHSNKSQDSRCRTEPPQKATLSDSIPLCDIHILKKHSLIIMEVKAAFINDDVLNTSENADFIRILKQKYVLSDKSPNSKNRTKTRPKGVTQLARSICKIISQKELSATAKQSPENIEEIFPVLVVHDSRVTTSLASKFLRNEFQEQLKFEQLRSQCNKVTSIRIHDCIVISHFDLERLNLFLWKHDLVEIFRLYSIQATTSYLTFSDFLEAYLSGMKNRDLKQTLLGSQTIAAYDMLAKKCFGQALPKYNGASNRNLKRFNRRRPK